MVTQISSASDFKSNISQGVALVDFFATWCGPCKMIAPVIDNLEKQYTSVKFYKVDIEEVPDVAAEYQISAVPTVIIFKNGEQAEIVKGANPAKLKQILESLN